MGGLPVDVLVPGVATDDTRRRLAGAADDACLAKQQHRREHRDDLHGRGPQVRWLAGQGVRDWADVRPVHVREFIIGVLETRSAGYANNLFRALQQFWKWWSGEEERPNPMAGMSPPMLPEQPVPVLRDDQLRALLKSCEGREFVQRRDLAIVYLFLDCGLRRAELAGLHVGTSSLTSVR